MKNELAYVLITPYSLTKSRTGGIIGRYISRTGLELVGARMFGPSRELTEQYAEVIRSNPDTDPFLNRLLAEYVLNHFGPRSPSGQRQRVLMLLFEGPDAIAKVREVTGPLRQSGESGESIRDTYGDFIVGSQGEINHIEPAVFMGPNADVVERTLRLWASFSEKDGGMIESDAPPNSGIEKTLVILKPDNFRFPSARPGHIIDLFSRSGLRIVAAKVHRMSVAEAEEFYGPVRQFLREKHKGKVADLSARAISETLRMALPESVKTELGAILAPLYGDHQFYEIIQFMTGCWGAGLAPEEKTKAGKERSLVLVYSGVNAVDKIRGILGPTDPSKALPGSVRREFGQDIMVNAAHASDSTANAQREMNIVKPGANQISELVSRYYA